MPNFLKYYESVEKKSKGTLLNLIATECGVSYITVSQKLTKLRKGLDPFNKLEKEKIAQLLKSSVEELFPQK